MQAGRCPRVLLCVAFRASFLFVIGSAEQLNFGFVGAAFLRRSTASLAVLENGTLAPVQLGGCRFAANLQAASSTASCPQAIVN